MAVADPNTSFANHERHAMKTYSAKPDDIRFADNLPKTRSGKIMRRLLRAIARDEVITQGISTLENPAIVEQLRGQA